MSMFPPQAYGYKPKRKLFKLRRYKKWMVNGSTGGGKSTWIEEKAEQFLRKGALVWDLWAAENFENCFWSLGGKLDEDRKKDPTARTIGYPVLVIRPRETELEYKNHSCTCGEQESDHKARVKLSCLGMDMPKIRCKHFVPLVKDVTDDVPIHEWVRAILAEKRKVNRVIVFNQAFYLDERDAYKALASILKQFRQLVKKNLIPTMLPNVLIFREVGDLVTGGMKTVAGPYQTEVRRQIQALIRKPRHVHAHMFLDAQRDNDIASAVAEQKDYLVIKNATYDLIPERYEWVIDEIEAQQAQTQVNLDFDNIDQWPAIPDLKKDQCYVVHPDRVIELRTSGMPGFLHKREHDDWRDLAGIGVTYLNKEELRSRLDITRQKERDEKKAVKDKKMETAIAAYYKHKEDPTKNTWDKLAKDVGWLGKDGKPSGGALKFFVGELKRKGKIKDADDDAKDTSSGAVSSNDQDDDNLE